MELVCVQPFSAHLLGFAESLHQQGIKLKPSSIDRLLYAESTKLLDMNVLSFLDFAKILQSPVQNI